MNTLETIFSRKSIRSYTGEAITEDQLNTILKAAIASPIGMGKYEDVHLTVITNPELLNEIDAECATLFNNPDMHPLYNAPMLILVSAKMPDVRAMENVSYSNAAIIVQNMALAATELGIGSCHIWGAIRSLLNAPLILEKLNLPEGFTACCGIILGKTDSTYEEREIPMDRISMNTIK